MASVRVGVAPATKRCVLLLGESSTELGWGLLHGTVKGSVRLKSLIVAYVYSSGLIIRRCNSPSAPLVTCVTCANLCDVLLPARQAGRQQTHIVQPRFLHVAERYAIAVEPHRVRTGLVVFLFCLSHLHEFGARVSRGARESFPRSTTGMKTAGNISCNRLKTSMKERGASHGRTSTTNFISVISTVYSTLQHALSTGSLSLKSTYDR